MGVEDYVPTYFLLPIARKNHVSKPTMYYIKYTKMIFAMNYMQNQVSNLHLMGVG